MAFGDFLEKDRERLMAALYKDRSAARASQAIREELDRLLVQYNEQTDEEYLQLAAAQMLQSAGLMAPLMEAVNDSRIWEEKTAPAKGNKTVPVMLIILGVLLTGLFVVLVLAAGISPWYYAILGPAVLSLVIGTWMLARAGKPRGRESVEMMVDPAKVYQTLYGMVLVVDRSLEDLKAERLTGQRRENRLNGPVPEEILALCTELLEAAYSEDGEAALESIGAVKFYLHQKNIQVVDYSGEHDGWFEMIPSPTAGTIRPALVYDGMVLRKGLAAGGM